MKIRQLNKTEVYGYIFPIKEEIDQIIQEYFNKNPQELICKSKNFPELSNLLNLYFHNAFYEGYIPIEIYVELVVNIEYYGKYSQPFNRVSIKYYTIESEEDEYSTEVIQRVLKICSNEDLIAEINRRISKGE